MISQYTVPIRVNYESIILHMFIFSQLEIQVLLSCFYYSSGYLFLGWKLSQVYWYKIKIILFILTDLQIRYSDRASGSGLSPLCDIWVLS